jgi:hypothetical protein
MQEVEESRERRRAGPEGNSRFRRGNGRQDELKEEEQERLSV